MGLGLQVRVSLVGGLAHNPGRHHQAVVVVQHSGDRFDLFRKPDLQAGAVPVPDVGQQCLLSPGIELDSPATQQLPEPTHLASFQAASDRGNASASGAPRIVWGSERGRGACHDHRGAAATSADLAPTDASWRNWIEAEFAAVRHFAFNGTDHRTPAEQDTAIGGPESWRRARVPHRQPGPAFHLGQTAVWTHAAHVPGHLR
ncbi:hypothetical protein Vqi01_54850 [Micromonospora qiuiae]|uniref:Uncharacterized protein n=1 Tax=Micromonospora qiuiae TaxID=502268 RepID=A0ABQ4JI88_9ACTN|nr:hypothetical protein Vqi01_54850 [Micromonospora qiuiae]